MTSKEAGNIITRMKQGLNFAEDDMLRSEISYWKYNSEKGMFHFERYDTVAGIFLEEYFAGEAAFTELLVNKYGYDEFLGECF